MTAWERANRPKPPSLHSLRIFGHMRKHGTCRVHYYDNLWWVEHAHAITVGFADHMHALNYAHKLAYERSQ